MDDYKEENEPAMKSFRCQHVSFRIRLSQLKCICECVMTRECVRLCEGFMLRYIWNVGSNMNDALRKTLNQTGELWTTIFVIIIWYW